MSTSTAQKVCIAQTEMTLRELCPADAQALLKLHQEVFSTTVGPSWFDWKYPNGHGQGMALWHGDAMIAFCGGLPRRFYHQGSSHLYLQIGDVMVRPDWRAILSRRGAFFQVSQAFYETRIGKLQKFEAGFGFPSSRHLTLAAKLNLLESVGNMYELRWQATSGVKPRLNLVNRWLWQIEPLSLYDQASNATIDGCWARMRKSLPNHLLGQRDAQYLRWRYHSRPDVDYVLWAIKRPWHAQIMGVAVMSRPQAGSPTRWLDWVGPPEGLPVAASMCWQRTQESGSESMVVWASDQVAKMMRQLAHSSSWVTPIGSPLVSLLQEPRQELPWWFMGGDTDFL